MSNIPFLDLKLQYQQIREQVREAVDRVFDAQQCIGGPEVAAFESEVAEYLDAPHAISCSNGSDAIVLALKALDIGPGDEVICPTFTFFATAGSISVCGATPVFADIQPGSFNIDPSKLEQHITKKTKAIIAVDLYGQAAEMDEILEIASKHSVAVIEDAAQAIGAEHNGRRVGSIAPVTTFSFYPTKNLGACGEGGLVTTQSEEIAEKLLQLRNHGQSERYFHHSIGMNGRLNAVQAAILRIKLRELDRWTGARQSHANIYQERLAGLEPNLVLPEISERSTRHVFNQFCIRVQNRDAVRAKLTELGVGSGVYYPLSLHLQPCFAHLGYKPGDFPVSEQATQEILALPIFAELTSEQVNGVCDALIQAVKQ